MLIFPEELIISAKFSFGTVANVSDDSYRHLEIHRPNTTKRSVLWLSLYNIFKRFAFRIPAVFTKLSEAINTKYFTVWQSLTNEKKTFQLKTSIITWDCQPTDWICAKLKVKWHTDKSSYLLVACDKWRWTNISHVIIWVLLWSTGCIVAVPKPRKHLILLYDVWEVHTNLSFAIIYRPMHLYLSILKAHFRFVLSRLPSFVSEPTNTVRTLTTAIDVQKCEMTRYGLLSNSFYFKFF